MLPAEIQTDEATLAAFCLKYGVARLSLFGSVLRRDFEPGRSDVDVLVEFRTGVHKGLFKLLEMQRELTRLFGRRVDLTTPGSLSKYFRDDVLATAQVLYDAA
jgi:predicted nucleotidyltransferase